MSAFTANKNAFEAYNILYYPMLGAKGMFNVSEEAFNTAVPQNEDWAYALTIQENLGGSPYRLSQRAVTALAKLHRVLSDVMGVAGTSALNALLPDPASDVMGFLPPSKHWTVMYPGFPTQVLEMDEADFRLDQARHYASTYGVELISAALGIAADVGETSLQCPVVGQHACGETKGFLVGTVGTARSVDANGWHRAWLCRLDVDGGTESTRSIGGGAHTTLNLHVFSRRGKVRHIHPEHLSTFSIVQRNAVGGAGERRDRETQIFERTPQKGLYQGHRRAV